MINYLFVSFVIFVVKWIFSVYNQARKTDDAGTKNQR
jgi:hypothetical protein